MYKLPCSHKSYSIERKLHGHKLSIYMFLKKVLVGLKIANDGKALEVPMVLEKKIQNLPVFQKWQKYKCQIQ